MLKNKQYVNQSHHVSQRVFTKYRQAMTENEISKIILDCAFKVHTKLGSGLLEKVYRQALAYELNKSGLVAEQEVAVPVYYEEIKFDCGYRIDILVNRCQVAQGLTYMRFSNCKLGLLLNFYKRSLKDGIKRLIL